MPRLDTTRLTVVIISIGVIVFVVFGDDLYHYLRRTISRARVQAPGWFTWRSATPMIVALVLAALMRIPIVSIYMLVVGGFYMWRSFEKARLAELAKLNGEVAQLVFSFRNIYRLQPVIHNAVKESMSRLDEPLRGWVDAALQAYRVTSDNEDLFRVLRAKSDNHYLNQFVYVLEMSGSASEDRVVAALESLSARLRGRESLQRETEVELGSVTSQTGMIQFIGIGVLFLIALVPILHNTYLERPTAQFIYIVLVSIAVASSLIIDRRIDSLRERAL